MLLPFQIIAPAGATIMVANLLNLNTNAVKTITTTLIENGLTIKHYEDFSIIIYPGNLPVPEIHHEGRYQLMLSGAQVGFISEIFTIVHNLDNYAELEYWNNYNFTMKGGIVDFSDNFKFKCYLPTQIGKPEYSFEEEATERMGYSYMESQVSKKIYKFTVIAPEYLCDALRLVRMCDNKQITSKGITYDMTSFNMSVNWQEQGDLAAVNCEFETDTVIANIGGYVPEPLGGDFNGDYNKDFDIE